MADILTYMLKVNNLSEQIGINNMKQLEIWASIESQVIKAEETMQAMGVCAGSIKEKIAALEAQKEWIPFSNVDTIKAIDSEIQSLQNTFVNINPEVQNLQTSLEEVQTIVENIQSPQTIEEVLPFLSNPDFNPVMGTIQNVLGSIGGDFTSFFDEKIGSIKTIIGDISQIGAAAILQFLPVKDILESIFNFFINGLAEGNPLILGLATVIGVVTSALMLYTTWTQLAAFWTQITTVATQIWSGVQTVFNAIMAMNPVFFIIAGIIALIAIIAYVVYSIDGWGKTWSNIITFMKLGIELFKEKVNLIWLNIKDAFLSGFETIAKGWYKVKSLWDEEGAQEGLAKLEQDRNKRTEEIAAAKNKVEAISSEMSNMKVFELKSNGKTVKDAISGVTKKLNLGKSEDIQGAIVPSVKKGERGDIPVGNVSTQAIAAGGSRSTDITINFQNLIENIVFQGSTSENRDDIERNLAEAMFRVLNMAQSSVS